MRTGSFLILRRMAFIGSFSFLVFVSLASAVSCTTAPSGNPRFVATIPNVTVTEGRDASLPCVVENIGEYKVAWFHLRRSTLLTIDDAVITLIPRFRISKDDSNTWTLQIEDVEPQDTGYYICQVNMEPVINQVGYVQVVVPPKFIDEKSSQSHVSVHEENDISLVCKAEGVPKPTIRWTREDGKAFTVKGSQELLQIESEELEIKSVTRKDMGAYFCIASNKVPPSISKRIVLEIHFQPVITIQNQLVGAPIGTSVMLECQVSAFPKAVHFWKFKEQLLMNSTRLDSWELIDGYVTTMRLSLKYIQHEDFGTYVCAAKNSLGEAESTIRLYEIMVTVKKEEEPIQENNQIESVIHPEQRNDDRVMDSWLTPEIDNEIAGRPEDNRPSYVYGDSAPPNPFNGRSSSKSRGTGSSGRNSHGISAGVPGLVINWKMTWVSICSTWFGLPSAIPRSKSLWPWLILSFMFYNLGSVILGHTTLVATRVHTLFHT